ncbi:hypothetical protein [Synechococcus phage S-B68]|nr:hypothetical protein [Synechococcus phage S-B68]
MSNSRWSRWIAPKGEKKLGFSSFIAEADQPGGNPTGDGMESPAQKAQRMGLVSDGHGAYSDPNTGQVVARTINGELVFYDAGAGGGVASDGEGGEPKVAGGAAPTYRDSETGMVTVPPAKPETPEALAAVPDPTPATAPANFSKFMAKRTADVKADIPQGGEEVEEPTIASRRDKVDAAREAGLSTGDAHEAIHGTVDLQDPESVAKLAATMGRMQKDGGAATIATDSNSMLAQEKDKEKEPKGKTLDAVMDAAKKSQPVPTAKDAAEARAGGTSAGAGTVHEIALLQALGGTLSETDQQKLEQNLSISGANGQAAYEIAQQNAEDLKTELGVRGITDIDDIVWTAQLRGEGLAQATGIEGLSDKNNQSDIIVKGKDANGNPVQYGVSLKVATSSSTKYPNDIPFFNGGLGKESARFGAEELVNTTKDKINAALQELGVEGGSAKQIKAAIRADADLKKKADEAGLEILQDIRDEMINSLADKDVEAMRELFSTMTGAPTGDGQKLPTLKLTGYAHGNRKTKIEDSLHGTVPMAIRTAQEFTFEPAGKSGIRVLADGVPVMKLRSKWESQALGSSIKFSGESP